MSESQDRKKALTLVALGRPFQLGMLYDCRSDALVTGLSLWDKKTVEDAKRRVSKTYSSVHLITKDDLDSKMAHIGASAGVKLSLMSDMVKVAGSAEFFMDRKKSNRQMRTTLEFQSTSKFEELFVSKEMMEKAKLNGVMQNAATHIVTGILYGADAYFVFDCDVDKKEKKIGVKGGVEATVKNLPQIGIGGSLRGSISNEDIKLANSLSCTFYGDIILDHLPTTYYEAVTAYRTLTDQIGPQASERNNADDKSVPIKVWLLPLSVFVTNVPFYVHSISDSVSTQAQKAIEALDDIKLSAADLQDNLDKSFFFDFIRYQIKQFLLMIDRCKIKFIARMKEMLPKIRGNIEGMNEGSLIELLHEMTLHPFDPASLHEWLENKENEADTLKNIFLIFKEEEEKDRKLHGTIIGAHNFVINLYAICQELNLP